MAESADVQIGFEGLATETDDNDRQKSYTIKFSSSDPEPDPIPTKKSEEIVLLERSQSPDSGDKDRDDDDDFMKDVKDQTVFFDSDPEKRIDFVIAYQIQVDKKKGQEDTTEKQDKRTAKRKRFFESCEKLGLELELQDCSESPDRKTYFMKVHGTHIALLKGAEELLLKMPIEKNNLKVPSYRERFFACLKMKDPFDPKIPDHLVRDLYFSAPFKLDRKENFIGWDDKKFFTTAQRSAIVEHILHTARYGEAEDQIGILKLVQNKTFNCAFPLHESSYKFDPKKDDINFMTDRQFLKSQWSSGWAWYKKQPLDQIRRYFGEKVGIYFAWLGFYTTWLLPASLVGIVIFIYGLSTINTVDFRNPIANATCDRKNQYDFYMCPRCDERCDFWFLADSCNFSYVAQLFDNAGTVFFAIFMAFWAVLFLEFWKRKQYYLQYDWDVLGYEDTEQRARPEFEQKIKKNIRKCKTEKEKEKFYIYNEVLGKREYIQPQWWLYPKILATFSILVSMILVVIGVVIAVLVYRLVVASLIYAVVANIQNGPSVGDIAVSISGACIQLVAIIVMNRVYEWLAYKLTKWELHRTQTEFEDNFITKMYLFQFVNFYSSLFYIAFFKGNVAGHPGAYNGFGGFRLDECATYGCLLELTIQLGIIFLGKQILNNAVEIFVPYLKRFINKIKHKEETDDDVYTRWEKDYDLIPLSNHGLFFEYLELVIQYGFVTLFVAAFPLAPLFALLNNYFEIRIDAHKFVVVLRRPVPERAQDIGAWFGILTLISQLSIITNAFIIVVTGQFIPQLVFRYSPSTPEPIRLSDYVNWSLSAFSVNLLVDGRAFPSLEAQSLNLVDFQGNDVVNATTGTKFFYFPYVDQNCIALENSNVTFTNTTKPDGTQAYGYAMDDAFERFYLTQVFDYSNNTECDVNIDLNTDMISCSARTPSAMSNQSCYQDTMCRFRGFTPDQDDTQSLKYWELQTARLAFVIVFEHLIIVVASFLAFLVPDVPQSVKNEIQREKLLAFEALHSEQVKSGIVEQTAAELEMKRDEATTSGEYQL